MDPHEATNWQSCGDASLQTTTQNFIFIQNAPIYRDLLRGNHMDQVLNYTLCSPYLSHVPIPQGTEGFIVKIRHNALLHAPVVTVGQFLSRPFYIFEETLAICPAANMRPSILKLTHLNQRIFDAGQDFTPLETLRQGPDLAVPTGAPHKI